MGNGMEDAQQSRSAMDEGFLDLLVRFKDRVRGDVKLVLDRYMSILDSHDESDRLADTMVATDVANLCSNADRYIKSLDLLIKDFE